MPTPVSCRSRVAPTIFVAVALALLSFDGLFAYTVHLKDGSTIVTKKKYVVQGDKAILTLPSGTETALRLAEIDIARTDSANQEDIGTAIVIENGKATDLKPNEAPPPSKPTLKDLLEQRAAAQGSTNAGAVAIDATPGRPREERPSNSHAGQAPLRDEALSTEIRTFIFGRGITNLEVQQGPSGRKPRLVFQASSEIQVFRALQASAGALLVVREKFPGKVDGFDVVCDGPGGGRGGSFALTPAQAADLVAGRIDLPTFFVQNVEF